MLHKHANRLKNPTKANNGVLCGWAKQHFWLKKWDILWLMQIYFDGSSQTCISFIHWIEIKLVITWVVYSIVYLLQVYKLWSGTEFLKQHRFITATSTGLSRPAPASSWWYPAAIQWEASRFWSDYRDVYVVLCYRYEFDDYRHLITLLSLKPERIICIFTNYWFW